MISHLIAPWTDAPWWLWAITIASCAYIARRPQHFIRVLGILAIIWLFWILDLPSVNHPRI